MSDDWYSRPMVWCADMQRTLAFYIGKLGFTESWRYEEGGSPVVLQVSRNGCELIFTCQPHMNTGATRLFISLDREMFEATRRQCETNGVATREGQWGYRIMIVADPDGNELFFPWPSEPST